MRKFFLVLCIFLFGLLVGGAGSADYALVPAEGPIHNAVAIHTDSGTFNNFDGILTNYKYTLKQQENLKENHPQFSCLFLPEITDFKNNLFIISINKIAAPGANFRLSSVNPRAP